MGAIFHAVDAPLGGPDRKTAKLVGDYEHVILTKFCTNPSKDEVWYMKRGTRDDDDGHSAVRRAMTMAHFNSLKA